MASFTEKLDKESLDFFNMVCEKKFSEQAVYFLNAYWAEVGSQADFIFSCAWEVMKYADMHTKGVNYVHLYDEGNDLDFNIGLYFYEKLCKKVLDDDDATWRDEKYALSQPVMMTSIVRKKELRDKVDVNFDGRLGFLEYLLYQYREHANPHDFIKRSMAAPDEHPEVRKARLALEEVNKAMKAYEAERHRLTEAAALPGVKGLTAKHTLAQLDSGPLKEQLNKALITAEAAVRIATRKFGGKAGGGGTGDDGAAMPSQGAIWWMNRDLEEKKRLYGRNAGKSSTRGSDMAARSRKESR